jgi:anaphase-promoting complex subunit 6
VCVCADLGWLRELYRLKLQREGVIDQTEGFQQLVHHEHLAENIEVQVALAEDRYRRNLFHESWQRCNTIMEQDPFNVSVLPTYVCCLVALKMNNQLFFTGHHLVDTYPKKAVSWYAVGCYYFLLRKHDVARRYFSKCHALDAYFAPGWIGCGHAFALQDESDQAMGAYRTAARLFEGSHVPPLCIGVVRARVCV